MMTTRFPWLALGFALSLGCATEPAELPGFEARSSLPRVTPEVSAADLAAVVQAGNRLAFSLFRAAPADTNLVVAPHGLARVLAMTWAGAGGATADELAGALGVSLPPARWHAAMNALDLELAGRTGSPLAVYDQLLASEAIAPTAAYLDLLAADYGTGVRLVDFAAAPGEVCQAVNAWAADSSDGRLDDLIPGTMMTTSTTMVVADGATFSAAWHYGFRRSDTDTSGFTRGDGSRIDVPMMSAPATVGVADGPGWSAADIPFLGDDLAFLLIVPATGELERLAADLDADRLAAMVASLKPATIVVSLPRFEVRSELALRPFLANLGVEHAFSAGADFTGLDPAGHVSLADVAAQAYLGVDENGSSPGADRGGFADRSQMMRTVRADRPFLFVIRDRPTGAVLFVGRVVDPTRE
jgi:serpin B